MIQTIEKKQIKLKRIESTFHQVDCPKINFPTYSAPALGLWALQRSLRGRSTVSKSIWGLIATCATPSWQPKDNFWLFRKIHDHFFLYLQFIKEYYKTRNKKKNYSILTNWVNQLQCSRNKEEWRRAWYSETNYMPRSIIIIILLR